MKNYKKIYKQLSFNLSHEMAVELTLEKVNNENGFFGVRSLKTPDLWDNYFGSTIYLYIDCSDEHQKTLAYDVERRKFLELSLNQLYKRLKRDHIQLY
jgi:hypothetical protein